MSENPRILPQDEYNSTLESNVHPWDWQNPDPAPRYNLVIIGAGTAGLITAAGAAGLGARVALVERHLLGGDCLNVGCVPSKCVIRSSRAAADVRYAEQFGINRADQDLFALRSQQRASASQLDGFFANEIVPVTIPQRKKDPIIFSDDEHIRASTSLEGLAKLPTPFREGGTVTAGNASGLNDGACAMLLASSSAVETFGLTPKAKVLATAVVGLEPRIMGFGPAPSVQKALALTGLSLDQIDVIELNEAFAAQGLAVTRELALADDDPRVNPNGGAIALGHPLGMSGARLVTTAINQLNKTKGRYALCTMCIGVGQGIATIIERV